MSSSLSYGIFADPIFIRKNILINFIYSNFTSDEFRLVPIIAFSDNLRAIYHNLSLENDSKTRLDSLTLAFSTLSLYENYMSELDWFYVERIIIHFVNFNRPVASRITFLLNRN